MKAVTRCFRSSTRGERGKSMVLVLTRSGAWRRLRDSAFALPRRPREGQVPPPPLDALLQPWCRSAGLGYPALMPAFICTACGTQYPPSEAPPDACPVCVDERQFVPASGQSWTTLEGLRRTHSNKFRRLATGLTTIETTPAFAHRAARDPGADAGRQRAVGLHRARRRRHGRSAAGSRRGRGDRDLAPALLHHDGRVEPRARRRADPPACGRSRNG